jgi:hypothetical protein
MRRLNNLLHLRRPLLIVGTLMSVGVLAWCVSVHREGERQRAAAEFLQSRGFAPRFRDQPVDGESYFNDALKSASDYSLMIPQFGMSSRRPTTPKWLRFVLGEYCFAEIVDVGFMKAMTEREGFVEALDCIAALPSLERVSFATAPVTDEDLQCLKGTNRLSCLILNGTSVDGTGLAFIHSEKLKELNLAETRLSDEGLRRISRLTELERLSIKSSSLRLTELKQLNPIRGLKEIRFSGDISDEGIEHGNRI